MDSEYPGQRLSLMTTGASLSRRSSQPSMMPFALPPFVALLILSSTCLGSRAQSSQPLPAATAATAILDERVAPPVAGRLAPKQLEARPDARTRGDSENEEGQTRQAEAATQARRANPPNEFQRFISTATGEQLPVFGETYFSVSPQTFAPIDRAPVPAEYVVGAGDELLIRAWGGVDIDYRVIVDRSGQISIPRIGSITVAGTRASDLESRLKTRVGRVYKNFELNVSFGQLRSIQVFVVGAARQPGTYTVSSLSTLVNAVFASGGPGPNGSMRRVILRRGNTTVTELDLYDFVVRGSKGQDAQLQAGDAIVYVPAGPRVAVRGAVDTAAIYELKPNGNSIAEMLVLAGGSRALANLTTAQVERVDPTNPKAPRQVLRIDLALADRIGMQDGDILSVFPASPQFANAVTLRGNVAKALRHPYVPGMRVSDLIPERDALITRDYYVRKNKLVQFEEPKRASVADTESAVRNIVDEPNWEYATIERLDNTRITTVLLPFHLGKAVLERDPQQNLLLEPGDVITVFGAKDVKGPQARSNRLVKLEGEVDRPGIYQLLPGETLRALIQRAGGVTQQAYVYGIEFTREETRRQQTENLNAATARLEALAATQTARNSANRRDDGNATADAAVSSAATQAQLTRLSRIKPNGRIALELDPKTATVNALPDVPLEDGDTVKIPPRPGFVTVAGAVVNNNAFLWRDGRTAGDYIRLAGLDEGAQVSNVFILRADGTVQHAAAERGLFGVGGLQSQPLYPGDAVVVPNQLDYETWGRALVRNLKDWSQIFSQFGLGAAAIKTLRN